MDNEDGGGGYDVSKKILVSELKAFLGIVTLPVIAQDIVAVGDGVNIESSNARIGDDGDPADMFFGHSNVASDRNEAGFFQGEDGNTTLNSKLGENLSLVIDNDEKILCNASGTQIAALSGQVLTVGLIAGIGIAGAKAEIRGSGLTDATASLICTNNLGGIGNITLVVQDDGVLLLKNGIIGGTTGETDDFVLSHKNHHTFGEAAIQQAAADGWTYLSSPAGLSFYIGAIRNTKITTDGIEFAVNLTQVVSIGIAAASGTGAKLEVRGLGATNATTGFIVKNSAGDIGIKVDDDSLVYLENGTGVNEISTGGDYSAATDDQLPTRLDVKTYVDGLITPQIIGGVTLSSSSNTNILNGTYVILADTTTVTSVTSGIGQDSNWTLEITEAGITNQKGVVTFTGNLEKDGGGGANYDVAIFKNGSIVSESEQVDQKLESGGKGQSVTVMAIIEFSTSDTFDIRVSGNGTADDIFCGGGSLYLK